MNFTDFQILPIEDAEQALLRCCGSQNWATQMAQSRPFGSLEATHKVATRIWENLEVQDWLEAFEHHPRIGDRQALAARFTSTRNWSANEQAGVEVAADDILDRLASGNDKYSQRFGYVFLVCASGKSAFEMLNLLEARINNSPEEELQIAQQEQQKIMLLRLNKMFEEPKK
ncbi:MAG: 2-oxo-4-hydroxy-4-carboxy-5-ureidoimidazoline decarboxylase [SAR324 cluster bacterium]|nr:2-oxo-4-hydroxy-4-carboxy-5-ureidoimidazoline decarboxylase [SAR324 cluster bacterium]